MCEILYYPRSNDEWAHHKSIGERAAQEMLSCVGKHGHLRSGVITINGLIAFQWGDVSERQMLPKDAKSLLISTLCAIALSEGKIPALDERIAVSGQDLTWRHLMGATFARGDQAAANAAAIALIEKLTQLFNRGLSETVRTKINDPIGSGFEIHASGDLGRLPNISSSVLDLARVSLLHLRRGIWLDRRIFSPLWIDLAAAEASGLYWCRNYPGSELGQLMQRCSPTFSTAVSTDRSAAIVAMG
jgi:hypothetical protein